jgi:hypothetical protein
VTGLTDGKKPQKNGTEPADELSKEQSLQAEKLRRHPRIDVEAAAWLKWTDENGRERHVPGKCLDISMTGALVETPAELPEGQSGRVGIPRIPLEATAVVRRLEKTRVPAAVGLEFVRRHESASRT